jgi:hypothetical protein
MTVCDALWDVRCGVCVQIYVSTLYIQICFGQQSAADSLSLVNFENISIYKNINGLWCADLIRETAKSSRCTVSGRGKSIAHLARTLCTRVLCLSSWVASASCRSLLSHLLLP